jgi:glycosyltransferase involved in cell wall biosynthesis
MSLLSVGQDIEVIIVDDGSKEDNTAEVGQAWVDHFPERCKLIKKENGGHGSTINAALSQAQGLYFKPVDSDDWLDVSEMRRVMKYLRKQADKRKNDATDLVIANYVYEKKHEGKSTPMRYRSVFPQGKRFTWKEVGYFKPSQYLLMHSVYYKTELLKSIGFMLPEHCFYVDNIYVYVPLEHVKTMYYIDADVYRYYIGREDQSVNETVMMSRIDQQLKVTRIMIDSVDVMKVKPRRLRKYLEGYLSMMMCICSVFLYMRGTKEDDEKQEEIWQYLKDKDSSLYTRVRASLLNLPTNLPSKAGKKTTLSAYKIAQKFFNFN